MHFHVGFIVGELFLLAMLALLSAAVRLHPSALPGDVGTERAVQSALLGRGLLTQMLEGISTLNWPVPVAVTLAAVAIALLALRRWLDAPMVIAIAAVSAESNYILSKSLHRPRPHGHGIHVLAVIKHYYSFPSGHVVYALAVLGFMLFLTYHVRRVVHLAILWPVRSVLLLVILLMPVSRVMEGEHWPSDVLGGVIFGTFWLLIATHIYTWLGHRFPRLRSRNEQ
ncbi:MAG: hypothetical protein NVSMB52_05360 [Chloroflexota bacterium]